MCRDQLVHGLRAEAPFQRAVDVRIEFLRVEAHRLAQRQMQAEDRPLGGLKFVELLQKRGRKLRASDVVLAGLMHVQRAGYELPGAHGASVLESYSGRLAALDHDAAELDLRREPPTARDECLHQAARQVGRAALAELVAALQIEGAD